MEYRAIAAQWHADRAARRPKPAKLALDTRLRQYVQDRLAGVIATPTGTPASGPSVPWKGRRHGRRQHRRWGRAWSPAQIARRKRRIVSIDISGTAAIAKIELDYPNVRFIDYMSLLKIDGPWKIIAKIFHSEPKQ